ncbi:hypothetical protein AAV94_11500 [Lampropedia cohaerens]|uniref:Uncharacterized protein n=1 Tax=Lampropedia cohaerens TaxID=1610491 RepID=A0A0U1PY34_9BURK|nr:hypothetical protein AAV94_11500 [Lampropedia cohaerens]
MLLMAAPTVAQTASTAGNSLSVCDDGLQDRVACRREMATVRMAPPQDPSTNFTENALRRCSYHKDAASRQACEERVRGINTQTEGAIFAGGMLREHRVHRVGPPAE